MRSMLLAVVMNLLTCEVFATPLVIVKTESGYVLGTNGSIVVNGKLTKQTCKPMISSGYVLISAGLDTLGHFDRDGKYVADVSLTDHFKTILAQGGSFAEVKAKIIRSSNADILTHMKKHPELYKPSILTQNFVLAASLPIGPMGIQVSAFSSEVAQPYATTPANMTFKTIEVPSDGGDVFLWHGHEHTLTTWPIVSSKKTQDAGRNVAREALDHIASQYAKEHIPGFDSPYVYVNVAPQGVSLVDPDQLCSKH
jgi:hypothetical protein